jgi:glycosyltransferase involved in cell wall biosynthesis
MCLASVADQPVDFEHLVQDAGSDDGTLDWLPKQPGIDLQVAADNGMYDALNRGFGRAQGEVCAYLNSDEQYLPDALGLAAKCFAQDPEVDVLFGHTIGIGPQGDFVCYRKAIPPRRLHTLTCHLGTLSASMFFRRRLFERGYRFDESFRALGDSEWVGRLLADQVRMGIIPHFTSTYAFTGENLSLSGAARREQAILTGLVHPGARRLRPLFSLQHRLRKWLHGAYRSDAIRYQIYTVESLSHRSQFTSGEGRPAWRWPNA